MKLHVWSVKKNEEDAFEPRLLAGASSWCLWSCQRNPRCDADTFAAAKIIHNHTLSSLGCIINNYIMCVIWAYHFVVKIIDVWWTDFQLQVSRPRWLADSGEGNRLFWGCHRYGMKEKTRTYHETHMFCFDLGRACCTGWENYAGDSSRWNAILPGNQFTKSSHAQ